MSNILVCTDAEHATILAALRHYQASALNEKDQSIYDIASNGGELSPLDDKSIDDLCDRINQSCPPCQALGEALQNHLTFGDIVEMFGVSSSDDPYAKAACQQASEGELEVDGMTVVSRGEDQGAYVMGWIWISNEEAGLKPNTELLVAALMVSQRHIKTMKSNVDRETLIRLFAILSWLDKLTSCYADELDLQQYEDINLPAPEWTNAQGVLVQEKPSTALASILDLADKGGFSSNDIESTRCVLRDLGSALDAKSL
jgi:hypothetical protein